MKKIIVSLFALTLFYNCKQDTKSVETTPEVSEEISSTPEVNIDPFTEGIETAHQKDSFLSHSAVKYDIDLSFGGRQILDATISVSTNSRYSIIEMKNGEKIYISDDKVYCSPGLKDDGSVRFAAYTWNYFFLFPYKLNDAGTKWSDFTPSESEASFSSKKLTFEANTGDAPDDWYVVFANKETHVLEHASYIVTLGTTVGEAEKDPHAIKYLDYKPVNGVPFAHNWVFKGWKSDVGLTNEIGNATLSNIAFVDDFETDFNIPEGYIER